MGDTKIQMVCPGCDCKSFGVYFTGPEGVFVFGSVWVECLTCGSCWTGTMELTNGVITKQGEKK